LRNQEPDDGKRGDGATRIVAGQVSGVVGPSVAGYGVLRGDCDVACAAHYGNRVPDPELTLGPHLAYTVQWYGFAVLAPVGAVLMLVRGGSDPDGPATRGTAPKPTRPPRSGAKRARSKEPTDEEIEDAL
jgi:hypothetical protein